MSPRQAVHAQRASHPVRFTVEASGDLLIHTSVWDRALALGGGSRYDFAPEFAQIKPYVAGADLALCHVETPMTPEAPTSYPIFNTPPALAKGIRATGWDACDTASNHSLDQGQTGIDDTGLALDHAGVRHTGSFPSPTAQRKLVILDVRGVKVAFLAYTTDTNGIPAPHPWSVNIASADRVLADARRARKEGAEAVIVNLHWGGEIVPEYQVDPSPGQLALVERLIASPRITAIVGQGPHAVQPIEHLDDKFVVFSEGNLISNQSPEAGLPASSQDGIVVLLDCVAGPHGVRVTGVRYVPVFVEHPDYTVLPIGSALKGGEGDATALRASYERTVSVLGKGKHIEPVPSELP
jgi:poly-gamma-glutamate synthesis protein (capsule biosynthesis protein)